MNVKTPAELAERLCMVPLPTVRLERGRDGAWWLLGCRDGDQRLPGTKKCKDDEEVLLVMSRFLRKKDK